MLASNILWTVLAAGLAVSIEAVWRRGYSWESLWWFAVPAAVLVNYAIYRMLTGQSSWLVSISLFGLMTASLRIVLATLVAHEPLSKGNLVAAVCLLTAVVVGNLWRA